MRRGPGRKPKRPLGSRPPSCARQARDGGIKEEIEAVVDAFQSDKTIGPQEAINRLIMRAVRFGPDAVASEVLKQLENAKKDEDWKRWLFAEVLGRIGSRAAASTLKVMSEDDSESITVRLAALGALHRILTQWKPFKGPGSLANDGGAKAAPLLKGLSIRGAIPATFP